MSTSWAINISQLIFVGNFEKPMDFNAVFTAGFKSERHMPWYELHAAETNA